MQIIYQKTLLSWIPFNISLQKAFVFVLLVTCALYLRRAIIVDRGERSILPLHSRHNATNSLTDAVEDMQQPGEKRIFIALDYWEQLTRATSNLLDLTALAAYGGRQVVVPFVRNSKFHGSPTKNMVETLELYYNVSALNHTLRSRGHGTLISWKEFQDICQGKLDVLVHLDFHRLSETTMYNSSTRAFFPCNDSLSVIDSDFKVGRTICMNVFAVTSVEKLESEVIEGLPCVGFDQWKGSQKRNKFRSQFQLKPLVRSLMRYPSTAVFFSPKLLHIAQDFIAKYLGPLFVSVHVRAERILTAYKSFTKVVKCLSNLVTQVQRQKKGSRANMPIFLATDFADYGSWSKNVNPARENAESLTNILAPLKPVIFQPSVYNLTDRGTVAIVEMNILVSGKHLSVVGGGQFQSWIVRQFVDRNSKYRIFSGCRRMCTWVCHFY